MVSPQGNDTSQCLNYTLNFPCKTAAFPVNQGFSSICLKGTFTNISESLELSYILHQQSELNIICKECSVQDSEFNISCMSDFMCRILFGNFTMIRSVLNLRNIFITFRNATLEDSIVQDLGYFHQNGNNQIHFQNSTLSCTEALNCGLNLGDISATKIVVISSALYNFRLNISMSELILVFSHVSIIRPSIYVKVMSLEYLKIPAIVQLEQVTVVKNTDNNRIVKRNANTEHVDYRIVFDLTNPYISIKTSEFIEVHLDIQSSRQQFEPVFFSTSLKRSSFINTYNVGNGGGLSISSQVQNSEVTISDCQFSNNTAVQGTGTIKGRGGGLYINANALKLLITGSMFMDNRASDSGLALYSSQGVDAVLKNCTFQYNLNPFDPIQQSLLFVYGKQAMFAALAWMITILQLCKIIGSLTSEQRITPYLLG